MRSSSSVLWLVSTLAWLLGCGSPASSTTAANAVAQAVSEGPGCRLTDGTTAALGAVAPSTDGTNTCTCGATHWSCTELAIHPPSAVPSAPPPSAAPSRTALAHYDTTGACTVTDGTVAALGVVMDCDDGCNTCTCEAGGWACTEMACAE